ncbi:MAG TPA: hypothetical protein PKC28_11035 [Bdellovibrionales bacterium]|nr:hypothetical protein [Bdellovibrionales bacterium]
MINLICIFAILSSGFQAAAQAQAKSKTRPRKPWMQEVQLGYTIWQESIALKNGAFETKMQAQTQGLLANYGLSKAFSPRWVGVYGIDAAIGTLKGKGESVGIADELKGQLWYMVGLNLGVMYRTSASSAIGLHIPAHYRMIKWKLDAGSALETERDASFSIGPGLVFENKVSDASFVRVAVTQHYQWEATMFAFSWKYQL